MPARTSLDGRRIALLESRKTEELAGMVERLGGVAVSAPTVRERPLPEQVGAFLEGLQAGRFRMVVFLTGVGAAALLQEAEQRGSLEAAVEGLRRVTIACRGPKPLAVMRRYGLTPAVVTSKPHTTRELLEAVAEIDLAGAGVLLVHYGERNQELASALRARGAQLDEVCPYEWALPEDIAPIERVIEEAIAGTLDAMLFTSQVQCRHLFNVAERSGRSRRLADCLNENLVIGAIGPVCAEALRAFDLIPDVIPASPNMGGLIAAVADYFELTEGPD